MTRASDTAKLLGAGATILDGTTISTADNTVQLTLTSTDADANVGPSLNLYRNSASPADADLVGNVRFQGENSAGETIDYVTINGRVEDVTDGTEDARIDIRTITAGADVSRLKVDNNEIVLNDSSIDSDFRVESNGNANMLFVDGGNDAVGIGNNNPADYGSLIDNLVIGTTSGNNGMTIVSGTDGGGRICFADNTASPQRGMIEYSHVDDAMLFNANGATKMKIDSSGRMLIATTTTAIGTAGTVFYGGADAGVGQFSATNRTVLYVNRSNDGTLVDLRSATASEGTISISGSTTSYNGGHLSRWSRLLNNSKDTSIVKGTVMTNLDEMIEWKHEKELWTKDDELPDEVSIGDVKKDAYTEDNEQLNKMAVSGVEGDANVAGVFVNWDNDDDYNDMNVAMTGDMVIRIAKDTTVAKGDLLMSAGDGTAKTQGDDIVRSKTIAKVTSTNVSHTYDDGTYLVPCVLMAC